METEKKERGFFKTINDDIYSGDLRSSLKKDWQELKDFFLDEEKKAQYANMNRIQKVFKLSIWLIGRLFYKLTPIRRLIFLAAVLFIIIRSNSNNGGSGHIIGGVLLVFLLLLELKDKLLAKEELSAGRKVQRSLMPLEMPTLEGWQIWFYYRSANEVCGDLIDYIKISSGRIVLYLADIAGKGLGAALLSSKLQSTIRAFADQPIGINDLISKVNFIFHRDVPPNTFASMIYVSINENDDAVCMVNAGHLPPYKIFGSELEKLPRGSLAIGLTEKSTYNANNIKMRRGEMLFIYSDGLTETRNATGEFFGEERLAKLLAGINSLEPAEAGKKIVAATDFFRRETRIFDDLSLIIIKKV